MNKNRIRGVLWRTSEQRITKSMSIQLFTTRKSGGDALKAVVLTSGGLCCVQLAGLRRVQTLLTTAQKSAEGIVVLGSRSARLRHSLERGETARNRMTGNDSSEGPNGEEWQVRLMYSRVND